jgi:bacterial/archaeal transporter family protein
MEAARALKVNWFWYSVLCVFFWGGWIITSKLGTNTGITDRGMQFIFPFGALPIVVALLLIKRLRFERSGKGIFYGLSNGVLSAVGGLALFSALSPERHWNTSVITAVTSLYPLVTVILAVTILRERLTWKQVVGLGFAVVAILIFSF